MKRAGDESVEKQEIQKVGKGRVERGRGVQKDKKDRAEGRDNEGRGGMRLVLNASTASRATPSRS